MKKLYAVIGMILLLSLLPVSLIHPVSADPRWWMTYWQEYKSYPRDNPYQIWTTKSVSDKWGYGIWYMDVALVVDIYQYKDDFWRDVVNIAVTVYIKSYANYGLRPIPASEVYIMLEKHTGEAPLGNHYINVVPYDSPPGYSQGEGLCQRSLMGSNPDQRKYWVEEGLGLALNLLWEPAGIIYDLISFAGAFAPTGTDYDNAGANDVKAWSRWYNPGYDFGSANPVRQYGFNCFRWFQELVKPNPSAYTIDIYASIGTVDPFWIDRFDTPPVHLCIQRRTGGGCPILSVYDGDGYVEEGSLDIHASEDRVVHHKLTVEPEEVEGKYHLRLTEPDLPDSHSYIDQVKLYALDDEGRTWECPLIRAIHSEDGNVKSELLFSDDIRTDTLPYEYVDLTFVAEPDSMNVEGFIFMIEGYNMK